MQVEDAVDLSVGAKRAEGAVDPSVGAKRVMYEIGQMTPETAGSFVNCEDGKLIPW
ncbi:hypothetical protein FOA52_013762 [Chlamydomonas sp. UWO 241]|nr:hypothetical protein FOA52_013762 [Chlamydomonas sp. UWO 241]